MKVVLVFVAVGLVLGLAQSFDFHEKELETEEGLWGLYERWTRHHSVSRSLDEKQRRFNVFKANARHVHEANKLDKPYKLALNKFADMSNYEFRSFYAGSKVSHHRMFRGERVGNSDFMYENVKDLPPSVDWRARGAVTSVKDQGQCGESTSCKPCTLSVPTISLSFPF